MNENRTVRPLHIWLLPTIWLLCYLVTCFSHDTKRLSMDFASFAGAWITMLVSSLRGNTFWVARGVAGLLAMAVAGRIMDFLRVRSWVYIGLVPFALLGAWELIQCFEKYPIDWVLKRDLGAPFIFISWGTYIVVLFSVIGALIPKIIRKKKDKNALTTT
jgi:hypothetical protein